ncbi:MAG TPA: hypothetical protein VF533_19905 [Solirubrobacteraceae bacterium]|jgi:hypothetical protein
MSRKRVDARRWSIEGCRESLRLARDRLPSELAPSKRRYWLLGQLYDDLAPVDRVDAAAREAGKTFSVLRDEALGGKPAGGKTFVMTPAEYRRCRALRGILPPRQQVPAARTRCAMASRADDA